MPSYKPLNTWDPFISKPEKPFAPCTTLLPVAIKTNVDGPFCGFTTLFCLLLLASLLLLLKPCCPLTYFHSAASLPPNLSYFFTWPYPLFLLSLIRIIVVSSGLASHPPEAGGSLCDCNKFFALQTGLFMPTF